ncbi:MAG: DUF2779 domain-containing protein [Planctomycetes bacterium]|nr:DUF2779 domain-containing protein [Planctomycetota bacterium]
MTATLAKSDWLTARACLAKAWYARRVPSIALTEADLFRMKQGREVGELAQQLYPGGILIGETETNAAAQVTQGLITGGNTDILFEATFQSEGFVAKADILKREPDGWHVLEVKSSFSDTQKIPALIDDLAYTVAVLKRSSLVVVRASLVLLSRDYRFGEGPERLFETVDKTTDALKRAADFEADFDAVCQALFADERPEPVLVSACRSCPHFESDCLGAQVSNSVLELPGLSRTKLGRLSDDGIVDLGLLPTDFELNALQERVRQCAIENRTIVTHGLESALESIAWPCHYLDFETVAATLPLYEGHGCHQQVLTQFSIHRRDGVDEKLQHQEYLADANRDCQRELAERLIATLGSSDSVIVYSDFERHRIRALGDTFQDLSVPLQRILDRLIDLLLIIKECVYHPDFRGSFSIKRVLPALVPDLSYEGLAVADGDTAITRFAQMARGEVIGEEADRTRKDLLTYCKLDTLAMVRLHDALLELGP